MERRAVLDAPDQPQQPHLCVCVCVCVRARVCVSVLHTRTRTLRWETSLPSTSMIMSPIRTCAFFEAGLAGMMSLTMTQLRLPLPAILHTEFDAMVDHACCLSTLGQALRYYH